MKARDTLCRIELPVALREPVLERLASLAVDWSEAAREAVTDPRVAATLPVVWSLSEFVADACRRDPDILPWLVRHGRLSEPADADWFAGDLRRGAAAPTDAEWMRMLRRFRRRHLVRIAWRDLASWAVIDETLQELSALADTCIGEACARASQALAERHGHPVGEDSGERMPLVILGMGKLGGRELNFSSDIDLVFLFPEAGETDGRRAISNEEYFLRVGQRVIQILANVTVDGFAYRVDMRLRPFGDSGPLVVSFAALESYLQQHGRDWERYAYVKARPITGAAHHRSLYDDVLRPFVYRRYLDFGVFDSLRTMKDLIAQEVERRDLKDNIKLGPGGIREIEFVAQMFQLIRGGSDPRLQCTEILTVLPRLEGAKLLSRAAVSELLAAYRYLRRVENRLQEWNDEQTHALPEAPDARLRLAVAMEHADWAGFTLELDHCRRAVSGHFDRLVLGPATGGPEGDAVLENLLDIRGGSGQRASALAGIGIEEPEEIIHEIDTLGSSPYYRRLDETGRRRLQKLLPRLLRTLAGRGDEAQAVRRLLKVTEMIGGRTVYLALLNENATALERLVDLCRRSQFLSDRVAEFPLLLDELIDARLLEEMPSRAEFARDLDHRLAPARGDPEREVEALKQFQRAATFRIAVADLTGRLPLMKVSDRLTDVAELIVGRALEQARAQVTVRHGRPMCGNSPDSLREAGMTVVAYGKFGGYELGYSSDLDLVFLHDSAGEIERSDGASPLDNQVYFARVAQRFVHLLTYHGPGGRLYEVDTRLRPSGKGGLLVQSLAGFASYQRAEAWTWEHQALLRARAVAGPAALRAAFESLRIELLRDAVRRADLKEQVRAMRERMRHELSSAGPGEFDLKQDAGGIGDIEFLAQYWALEHAGSHPEVVTFPDTIRILESLASGALVPQARIDVLVDAYRRYRSRLHHLALDRGRSPVPAEEFAQLRRAVIAIWDDVLGVPEGKGTGNGEQ
jgi:[glutamine synthetase] adenylyltransferase / [glutamine synthetase]-adenylyl-L-tyrosine phosphorylase